MMVTHVYGAGQEHICYVVLVRLTHDEDFTTSLDGRNRAIVIAESPARVIAAIRITSVRWRSYLPLKAQKLVLVDPVFFALRFESRDWRPLV